MTLLKDLIDIPERVGRDDFVLRLAEGIDRAESTVRSYVLTPQLQVCFDRALDLIRTAMSEGQSRGAYLHGSFGSGKSHFMAVLHLLLQGHPAALADPELKKILARHEVALGGKRFLMVPYHMIGARGMEPAILGHYVDHVRALHPNAVVPPVYRADRLFEDAGRLWETMGDEKFFAALNRSTGSDGGGWGNLAASWGRDRFEAAIRAPHGDEARDQLVSALVGSLFSSYGDVTAGSESAFVDLDRGLSILSRHAHGLGYDALILFLDELILWLASHAADHRFLQREGQKLAKLVEAETADRPIPIVSLIARQRDLRDFLGEQVPGAEQQAVADVLQWWEARFSKIVLEDRNLPAIVEKRLLRPVSESARQEIDAAFQATTQVRDEVLRVLLGSSATRDSFRQVYPFSPALVDTLVALSSLLQRERTALKAMVQLLVQHRDQLRLGEVVPVGDLWDVLAQQAEPFSDTLRIQFENARRLYEERLRPLLERRHNLRFDDLVGLPADEPRGRALLRDDRLVKTLILSALAPTVEALRALTSGKLAALNHGTIQAPIPGGEGRVVLDLFRHLASEVGEIRISADENPVVSVQLTGVDTSMILQNAATHDNTGNRRRKIRELLFHEIRIDDEGTFFPTRAVTWRATERHVVVAFENVREMGDEAFTPPDEGQWKVVLDFPFDDDGHGPGDDRRRAEEWLGANPDGCRTLIWIPSFLSAEGQRDLGRMVVLDHILERDRLDQYASHLSVDDRARARVVLDNQRSQLRERLRSLLHAAYGIAPVPASGLDTSHGHADLLLSLDPTFRPQPPVGADLGQAFEKLLDQSLCHQFPLHPKFEEGARLTEGNLGKVFDVVQKALAEPVGRVHVDTTLRPVMRQIAVPLQLGEMGETHFVLGHFWKDHLLRCTAADAGPLTVRRLREYIDRPQPRGLPERVGNLVILVFAAQTNRTFHRYGGAFAPTIRDMPPELELREQALPDGDAWRKATERAGAIFGVSGSALLNATNLQRFAEDVKRVADEHRAPARELPQLLHSVVGGDSEGARLRTANAVLALLIEIENRDPLQVVNAIAQAKLETSAQAMGTSLKKASEVRNTLQGVPWTLFDSVSRLQDQRRAAAATIQRDLQEALSRDEHAHPMKPALDDLVGRVARLLSDTSPAPEPPMTPPQVPPVLPPVGGTKVVGQGARSARGRSAARDLLDEIKRSLPDSDSCELEVAWTIRDEKKRS